jgi:hypothetical protein
MSVTATARPQGRFPPRRHARYVKIFMRRPAREGPTGGPSSPLPRCEATAPGLMIALNRNLVGSVPDGTG